MWPQMFNRYWNGHSATDEGTTHPKVNTSTTCCETTITSSLRPDDQIWNNPRMQFSQFCSNLLVTKKKDGKSIRVLLDGRLLNHHMQRLPVNLVTHPEIYTQLVKKVWLTVADLSDSFFQMMLKAECQALTAFYSEAHGKLYCFTRFPSRPEELAAPSETPPRRKSQERQKPNLQESGIQDFWARPNSSTSPAATSHWTKHVHGTEIWRPLHYCVLRQRQRLSQNQKPGHRKTDESTFHKHNDNQLPPICQHGTNNLRRSARRHLSYAARQIHNQVQVTVKPKHRLGQRWPTSRQCQILWWKSTTNTKGSVGQSSNNQHWPTQFHQPTRSTNWQTHRRWFRWHARRHPEQDSDIFDMSIDSFKESNVHRTYSQKSDSSSDDEIIPSSQLCTTMIVPKISKT